MLDSHQYIIYLQNRSRDFSLMPILNTDLMLFSIIPINTELLKIVIKFIYEHEILRQFYLLLQL